MTEHTEDEDATRDPRRRPSANARIAGRKTCCPQAERVRRVSGIPGRRAGTAATARSTFAESGCPRRASRCSPWNSRDRERPLYPLIRQKVADEGYPIFERLQAWRMMNSGPGLDTTNAPGKPIRYSSSIGFEGSPRTGFGTQRLL